MRRFAPLALAAMLSACVSPSQTTGVPPRQPATSPPPMTPSPPPPTSNAAGFRAPQVMQITGLENVIGKQARQLEQRFGPAQLRVAEGDAIKLQFSGEACVLDVFLYPLSPGATPTATHVEARRASDGRGVDRARCAAALQR